MAVIQYTGIVNQIRGKLNGSQFSKGRNANTLVKKASQAKGSRGYQSEARELFTFIQRQWKTRDASEKANWQQVARNNPDRDRFGQQVVLSGYNKYMQCQIRSLMTEDFIIQPVNTSSAPGINNFSLLVTSATFELSATGTTVLKINYNVRGTVPNSDFVYAIYVSLPYSKGVTVYQGRYSFVYGTYVPTNQNRSYTIDLGAFYPYPPQDALIQFKVDVYWTGNGVRVFEGFQTYGSDLIPQIASYTQDSTSPLAPRTVRISFLNKNLLDGVVYRFEARTQTLTGSCPVSLIPGNANSVITNSLFDNGVFSSGANVSAGMCTGWEVRIVHVPTNTITDIQTLYFSNL